MLALIHQHPLLIAVGLLFADLACWRLLPAEGKIWRVLLRLGFFLAYSLVIIDAGMSPLQPPPWTEPALNMIGSVLGIAWWLLCARTLTVVLGVLLMPRSGHAGRLLQDVLGAVIFLAALVAAAAYIMQLPVKGLLATSGVVAIVVGLALQSTLSDVFSGIVLNTTKPYRLDDWVSIDGTEGKVIEIDWRATHLRTSQGGTVVIPNSVAAKAKILNLNRTIDIHQVSISLSVPAQVRPRRVLDALNRTLQGVSALLPAPKAKVTVKASDLHTVEYEISGYVSAKSNKTEVRNLIFDLAHRHLQAAGILRGNEAQDVAHSRQRVLLDDVKIFRSLSAEEKDLLAEQMQPLAVSAGQVVLELGEVSEQLLVIDTGVVSAAVPDGERFIEAGRMGPGEIMGEQGIIHDTPSQARFTALSSGMLYRLDKPLIQTCLEQRSEVGSALHKLQSFRQQNSAALLVQKPVAIKKGGFLRWLQRS
ncbi:mechanosensitive ion channel protein MscS [Pseudomonas sp. HMWF032]|uniref:mechanosensitive ion channel family protein n=1 Tax=Pseudomonas sp. HMWF032 TaxID=2056866 RepID=UPI000D3B05C0|nr:mechanosensitive ion channel family protein [Pseudomonas sp. HMWF032]PTS86011.1 mechanosensitive ion channel protein MscS [Pseudomonas sp. HMWF032]PTT83581.1 mechanosensitive ion channel protein MscS [Pseudomonas sp. HMWF010]